jgi:hypothetical protein
VQTPAVEIVLADGASFALQRLEPEPGFGMITLHVRAEDDDVPDALIVPLGSIRRIELRKTAEERVGFGFSLSLPQG